MRHTDRRRRWGVGVVGVAAAMVLAMTAGAADPAPAEDGAIGGDPFVASPQIDAITAQATLDYWTSERKKAAQAYATPEVELETSSTEPDSSEGSLGEPYIIPGSPPGVMNLDPEPVFLSGATESEETDSVTLLHTGDPDVDYPPPYQRWTWFGRYLAYPRSTIGKIFFTQDDDGDGTTEDFVCSGSVISLDRVATAGHCMHNGLNGTGADGGWSTNVLFCPSYNANGVNPNRGCWASVGEAVTGSWFSSFNLDRDLGGFHTSDVGSLGPGEVGEFTGWLGRAINFQNEVNFAFGYPAVSPFDGTRIIACVGPHWYSVNWGVGADSKYIGCDQTGGSSGGPWILGLGHATAEYPDTPGDLDPGGGNWLNGVNSHNRVTVGDPCNGSCLHEMGSPPFTDEVDGSEDFFAFLFDL